MDQRYLKMLNVCRPLLHLVSDIEQLLPYLQAGDAVTAEELGLLRSVSTKEGRVDMILDIVSRKGAQAFSALCVALESTHPHILTTMFTSTEVTSTPKHPNKTDLTPPGYQYRPERDLATSTASYQHRPERDLSSSTAGYQYRPDRDLTVSSSGYSYLPQREFGLMVSSMSHSTDHEFGVSSSLGPPPSSLPPPIPLLTTSTSDSLSSKDSHSTALTLDSEEDGGRSPALLTATGQGDVSPGGGSSTSGKSSHSRPLSLNDKELCQDGVSLLKAELKVLNSDPLTPDGGAAAGDKASRLNARASRGLDPYRMSGQGRMSSELSPDVKDGSGVPLLTSPSSLPGLLSGPASLPGPTSMLPSFGHDYDRIKTECDRMNNELQSLEKKYDQAVKASNMYRQQYKVTKDKLDQVTSDLDRVTIQRSDLSEDKARLEGEVAQLTKLQEQDHTELVELRRQQREVMSESGGSFDGFSVIYDQALSRYESLKVEYDGLRKQYTDAVASMNTSTSKVDRLKEENDRLRKQCDQVQQERNSAHKDRKILQQHVTSAIQAANREKNDLLRELQDMKMERDSYRKKAGQLESQSLQMSKDVGRLKKERDAVVHEYTLVMSERDSVHKEMEQLQDKLSASQKKGDVLDKDKKSIKEEVEGLQREVNAVLEQRDRAIKQLNELKDKYGERRLDPMDRDIVKDLDRLMPERSSGRRDQKDLMDRRDHSDTKEQESLRKELEKTQAELTDTKQEKEDCKRRCDWAFTERDKIVRERESIRTLCDKLRHERDNAVSKLIEALRDTDELKKQKSEAIRELKDIKEKYDTLLEKEARKGHLHSIGHNHSHDSAIDADLQEWETETLQLEIGDVTMPDLGIDLVGGREDPQFPDNAVFVANIRQDSCARGKLKINDQLVKVNNVEVTNIEKSLIYQTIHNSGNTVHMIIRRRRMVSTRCILPVHVNLNDNELGLQLETGLYVCRILPGSAAAREGNLAVGDRVVAVNGHSVENMKPDEVVRHSQSQGDHVTFNIIKYSSTPQSSVALSSTPSSGHNLTESSPDGISLSPRSPQSHHRSWVSQSPDSANKGSLSLKCSGSQTDSLDSPQPSLHGGWSEHIDYPQTRHTLQEFDRKRKLDENRDTDYNKKSSSGMDYNGKGATKDYVTDRSLRHRSHNHRSHDRSHDHKEQRRLQDSNDQRRSHDSSEGHRRSHDPQDQRHSYGLVDHRRPHDQESRRSHDQDSRRSHDEQESRKSHDQTDKKQLYEEDPRRCHEARDQRKSHGDVDKRNFFDKAISRFQKSHNAERAVRDGRCKSGHPFFNMSSHQHTTEEEALEQLNSVLNQYENQASTTAPKKPQKDRRRDKSKRENGGTWPKCHGHVDHTHPPWMPPIAHKERPPLTNLIEDSKHTMQSSYTPSDGKLPPTPPERNDSFKRSASVKHSPQNSDSSKYSHQSSSSQSKSNTLQSYHSSPTKASSHTTGHSGGHSGGHSTSHTGNHATKQIQDSEESKPSSLDGSWGPASTNQSYEKVTTSMHYPTHSSPERSMHESLDYSVKSANSKVDKMYIPRQANRPISAPSNSRSAKMKADRRRDSGDGHGHRSNSRTRQDVDQKLQEIAEMLSQSQSQHAEVQKPTSLDIKPMYSPRPLPHSSHTMSHGQSASSAYHQGSSSSKPNHASGAISPRDTGGGSLSNKPTSAYPASVPATTQKSTQPVFQVASSQLVSPQGSGSISGLPTTPSPLSSQPLGSRYSSPTGPYMRGSGSSILNSSIAEVENENMGVYHVRDRLSTPSPSPSQQSSNMDHSVTTSDDFPYEFIQQRPLQGRQSHNVGQVDGCSTLPNRRPPHHHPRVASNHSVISHRSTTNSFERMSGRSSPVSPAYMTGLIDYTHMPTGSSNTLPPSTNHSIPPGMSHSLPKTSTNMRQRTSRPRPGETREIKVEKSIEPLGIQIQSGSLGGIFVSSVSDNSLASKAGITVGDQLLEVCGINMRNATKDLAASVLRQCGGSINMLVQYKPNSYHDDGASSSGPSSDSSASNTPEISHNRKCVQHRVSNETLTSDTVSPSTLSPSSMSPMHSVKPSEVNPSVEPRFVMLKKLHPHDNLGVTLVGGNSVGIFIRSVQPVSVSGGPKGLRYGDQILEYNGINFRNVTHEQAMVEISKPGEVVSILAQYNIQRLNKILDQPGDALYIRALFDRQADNDGELSFCKNDILFVDSTMHNGMMGVWRAWRVDDKGNKLHCGTIPSKSRLEEELSLKRSQSEVGEDELSKSSRRGSASARRSFFRKKKHQRSNSRDSRELNSFSDASINSDSVPFLDDGSLLTFERVERLDSEVCRPVLILAPLAEPLINKITSESPDKYCRCEPNRQFECVTVQSVKEIISKNRHCMLNADPTAIEHLHKVNIYPIVVFIKHKSSKEIREVKDTRFLPEKLSNKTVKELYETFQKYEQKYKRFFSDTISGGNLAVMCRVLKTTIDAEQKKTLWVPSGYL